jgi:hypothetical protein
MAASELDPAAAAAAESVLRQHDGLAALALHRTGAAAQRMVASRRARQRNDMRPYLLPLHARVRVSFLYASETRRYAKQGYSFLPVWTAEVYEVVGRRQVPGSRLVLYEVRAEAGEAGGADAAWRGTPCRIADKLVFLPLVLEDVDRRWLQPVPAEGAVPPANERYESMDAHLLLK